MEHDPEAIASDLVRALRGARSQTAFARRLGYRSNVPYTWESGRRWPPASTFLRAAGRVGVDLPAALERFLGSRPAFLATVDPATPEGVAALLTHLRGALPIGEVAARSGRSRFAVSRWLSGRAEPRLPDLLRVVEATSLRLLDFVAAFTDPAALPSTRVAWARLEAARDLAASPWAQAVLLALELAPYQALPAHDDGWIARRLGLPEARVTEALAGLIRAGHVVRVGPRLRRVEVRAVDLRRPASGTALKQHWSEVALDRLRDGAAGVWSYNLFTVSQADLARLEEMQRAHWRAIRALVADSAPAERVVLVNLQLVPLDAGPG